MPNIEGIGLFEINRQVQSHLHVGGIPEPDEERPSTKIFADARLAKGRNAQGGAGGCLQPDDRIAQRIVTSSLGRTTRSVLQTTRRY